MRIASGRRKPLSLPWRLLTALALLCATPQSVLAETDQPKAMPPCVARVLRWLPEDTETLVVARSVTLPGPDGGQDWQDRAVGLACEDVFLSREKKLEDLFAKLDPVQGRKIECMVRGARNFEGVSSFGSLRSESCTIIVFEKELGGDGAKWTESLRKGSKAVRRLVGREVFVYPSATVMEPWVKETEWQGTYFVLLEPGILLCASSDRYLETTLRRVNDPPRTRALPNNLPEWKQVDCDAPVWKLRHIPKAGEGTHAAGSTATFQKKGFRVAYIPKTGKHLNADQIRREWLPDKLFESKVSRERLKIVVQGDGAVIVSCDEKPGDDLIWFGWQLYRLQAFELFRAAQ